MCVVEEADEAKGEYRRRLDRDHGRVSRRGAARLRRPAAPPAAPRRRQLPHRSEAGRPDQLRFRLRGDGGADLVSKQEDARPILRGRARTRLFVRRRSLHALLRMRSGARAALARPPAYCGLVAASCFASGAQRAVSVSTNFVNSSGDINRDLDGVEREPLLHLGQLHGLERLAGSSSARCRSATAPVPTARTRSPPPGPGPTSRKVGMSGKFGMRFSVETASASTLPARICSAADENVIVPSLTCPARQIGERGAGAFVGNVADLVALLPRQIFAHQVPVRAGAGRDVAQRLLGGARRRRESPCRSSRQRGCTIMTTGGPPR